MTVGRTRVQPSGTRLPTRNSGGGLTEPATAPRLGGTLKRTSSIAGLNSDADSKRQLSTAMHDLSDLQYKHDRLVQESSSTIASLQAQLKEYITKTDRLERHRSALMAKEREAEEKEAGRRSADETLKEEMHSTMRRLRLDNSVLKDKNVELATKVREGEHRAAQAEVLAKGEAENAEALEQELERVQGEIAEQREEARQEREKRLRVEEELERKKCEKRDDGNTQVVKDELHRQVNHLRALEKDNAKLLRKLDTYEKDHVEVGPLKESVKSLEKKVRTMEALRVEKEALEDKLNELKGEKAEWAAFLKGNSGGTPDDTSPHALSKALAASRIVNTTLKEKLDTVQFEIQHRDRIIGELEARTTAVQRDLDAVTTAKDRLEARARQEESRQKLLKQEIHMLKEHLSTYAAEEQFHNGDINFDTQKAARLAELESILEAYKTEVAELSGQVSHWRGLVERYGGSTTEIVEIEGRQNGSEDKDDTGVIVRHTLEEELRKNESLQNQLDELRNTAALMEKEVESLELQVGRLTYAHGNGDFDPRTTKVLELRENPDLQEHAIRTATLERLRLENQALLATIEELEARKGAPINAGEGATVPKQSLINLQAELDAALAVVKQKETMELRLKSAFGDKADEFRKAVQSLLGYRLDFLSSGRVKVSSVYSPSKEYSLLFSSAAGGVGTMELLGPGSGADGGMGTEVQEMVKYWVGERACIPGFLASLTLTWLDQEGQL